MTIGKRANGRRRQHLGTTCGSGRGEGRGEGRGGAGRGEGGGLVGGGGAGGGGRGGGGGGLRMEGRGGRGGGGALLKTPMSSAGTTHACCDENGPVAAASRSTGEADGSRISFRSHEYAHAPTDGNQPV